MSRRWSRSSDGNQLQIDWDLPRPAQRAEPRPAELRPDPVEPGASPALRLRWDFRTRFPEPTSEALDAGLIYPEEAGPEAVRALHGAHAAELLGVLRDMDAEADARRGTVVPLGDGTAVTPERAEPSRLRRWYANLLGVYGDLFGPEAAEAFDKAVRAWHARVEVVVENGTERLAGVPRSPIALEPTQIPTMTVIESCAGPLEANAVRARVVARLPVPEPLPEAVAAGHFGHDANGPIRPRPDEVREITRVHAERLIDLVNGLADADRRDAAPAEVARRVGQLHDAVRKYAEDFGDHAVEQLLAHARRQAAMGESRPPGRGR